MTRRSAWCHHGGCGRWTDGAAALGPSRSHRENDTDGMSRRPTKRGSAAAACVVIVGLVARRALHLPRRLLLPLHHRGRPAPTPRPPATWRPMSAAPASRDAAGLEAMFSQRVGPVLGWDYQHVYPLGQDRWLWLFQDAFIDHSGLATNLHDSGFAHNAAMVQTGDCFTLLHGGTASRPSAFEPGAGERPSAVGGGRSAASSTVGCCGCSGPRWCTTGSSPRRATACPGTRCARGSPPTPRTT